MERPCTHSVWKAACYLHFDFMGLVKSNSSKWIYEQHYLKGRSQWQDGDRAFSYARSQWDIVIKYIINREEHHKTKPFREEYIKMLKDLDVLYNDKLPV
ncbi:MAG TPA: hypothetical protein VEY06_09150 [Flavisolibacter sp.]|nr:hypothetical protein [Flavisolibacter sp.]